MLKAQSRICEMGKAFIFNFLLLYSSIGWLLPLAARAQKNDKAKRTDAAAPPITYKQLRYEEDWSFLKDKSKRRDYADRLKYISLGKENWYLTIGGEARPMYESFRNENWGSSPKDDNGWVLQRYMLHADFHLGKRSRIFAQIKSGLINHRVGGARPSDLDKLDLHQLFFDYKFTNEKDESLTLRAGRQEISLGSSRLVGTKEGPNVRLSFDGIRLTAKTKGWSLDGFAAKPVSTDKGFFDDKPQNQLTFGGVYAVSPSDFLIEKGKVDFYYFKLDKKTARFNQGTEREIRHTIGTRIWKTTSLLDYNFEFAYQFGKFGAARINAWTAASDTGYTFNNWLLKPRLGLKADITSGDKNPNDKSLQTFNALFPRGSYFGQFSPIGPYNNADLHSSVTLNPSSKTAINFDWINFWRTSCRDGVYNVAGTLVKRGNQSNARFIGQQYTAEMKWQIDHHAALTVNYSRFNVGEFLRETPPAKNTDYFAAWVTYKF